MAQFIALTQVVPINEAAVFQGSAEGIAPNVVAHEAGTGIFALKRSGCDCRPARYVVHVHAVYTAAVADAPIQMALAVGGTIMPGTLMSVVPDAVGDVVSTDTVTEVPAGWANGTVSLVAVTADVPLTRAIMVINREGGWLA